MANDMEQMVRGGFFCKKCDKLVPAESVKDGRHSCGQAVEVRVGKLGPKAEVKEASAGKK